MGSLLYPEGVRELATRNAALRRNPYEPVRLAASGFRDVGGAEHAVIGRHVSAARGLYDEGQQPRDRAFEPRRWLASGDPTIELAFADRSRRWPSFCPPVALL